MKIMKNRAFKLMVVDESDISLQLDKKIRNGLIECFPADVEYFSSQSWWHIRPSWRVLIWNGVDEVIGHIAIVVRTLSIGATRSSVKVVGIQSVFVRPQYRGQGLSDRMMKLAIAKAKELQMDAGLLFRLPKNETVYGRMGWIKIDAEVFMLNEHGKKEPIPEKNIEMVYPLKRKDFPAGPIDLQGPDW